MDYELARSNGLQLKCINDGFVSYKHSAFHFTLTDELECVDYLWCFYQLFGLSLWRHPFTAEDPLVNKWCNAKFLKICFHEERKCFPSSYTFFLFATDLFPAVQQPWQGEEDRGRGRPGCSKPHRMECPGGEQGGRGLDPFRYTRIIISLDTCIAFYRK